MPEEFSYRLTTLIQGMGVWERWVEQMLVSSLMTSGVKTVSQGDSIESVAENMAANRYSCALVAEDGEPIGIITERDIVGFLLRTRDDADLLHRTAGELMTSPIKSIRGSESLFDVLVVSRADKIRHLPVVGEDSKLAGLVTQSDLSEAHQRRTAGVVDGRCADGDRQPPRDGS